MGSQNNACCEVQAQQANALHGGKLDQIGALASFLCALHCMLMPFVLLVAPVVAGSIFFDHRVERIFVVSASIFGTSVLFLGLRMHQDRRPAWLLMSGIVLASIGTFSEVHHHLIWHAIFLVAGGSLIAASHLLNRRVIKHSATCRRKVEMLW